MEMEKKSERMAKVSACHSVSAEECLPTLLMHTIKLDDKICMQQLYGHSCHLKNSIKQVEGVL